MLIIICKIVANYLIIRMFVGGGVNNGTSQFIEKLHSLLYVAKRLFIAQNYSNFNLQRYSFFYKKSQNLQLS